MAARAVLVVGRGADLHRQLMVGVGFAIGIGFAPFLAQRFEARGVHRLGSHVAMRQGQGRGTETGQQQQAAQRILVVHHFILIEMLGKAWRPTERQ
ncbi:hypothetical protein D9M73_298370 [compost metagenome]